MKLRWISVFFVFIGVIAPCMAQTADHHHKKVTSHKHVTYSSTKHASSHKLKNHTVAYRSKHEDSRLRENDRYIGNRARHHKVITKTDLTSKPAPAKVAASTIPQPQFDEPYTTIAAVASATALKQTKLAMPATATVANNTTVTTNSADNAIDASQIDTSQQALTALAYKTVETQRYSSYKLGGTLFDPVQGIYTIDCSTYIDDLLSQTNPQAFASLTNWTQTYKPTSHDYYKFITRLPDEPTQHWRKVNSVQQLQPGGILVFLSQYLHRHHLYAGSGHVMLVMSKPILHPASSDIYQIKVADSASSGHSNDTRLAHRSGIGIGTLLLKVDPFTGEPKAYAWKLDDHWQFHTLFAMAQPIG